jgi:Fe-S cluster assembly iron-binding protein IscA
MRCYLIVVAAIIASVAIAGCEPRKDHAVSASIPDKREPVVTLTDGAIDLLRQFAGESRLETRYVLVAVDPEGDAFRYFIDFGDPKPDDIAYTWKGVRLQVDRSSAPYLQGTVVEVGADATGRGAFRFNNPNALGPAYPAMPGEIPPPVKLKKAY